MGKIISILLRFIPRRYLQLFSHIPLKIYTFFLKGNNVECPVCDAKLTKFLPYGRLVSRPNALCPNCLALERHRLMALYMKQRTNFYIAGHSGGIPLKVLHVAPEYCFIYRFEEMKNLEYITADIESPLAKVKMDIHEIPFDANTFDVAICNHVMEHVNDYHKAMSELYRVLKPNGWAIIQSPQDWTKAHTFEDPSITDPRERERVFWQNDHLRLFGRDYGHELEKAGFTVTEDNFVMKMSKDLVKRYSLPSKEIVYFCEKK